MAKEKKPHHYHIAIQFNTNLDEDNQAVRIIEELKARGWRVRQIVTDALLRAAGHTPEMYANRIDDNTRLILDRLDQQQSILEGMLAKLVDDVLAKVRVEGIPPVETVNLSGEAPSPFASTFARGFLQRQQSILGDED